MVNKTTEPKGYVLGTSGKNKDVRYRKAAKIISILNEHGGLTGKRVFEIGTGAGYIAHALSEHAKSVDSVDIVDDRKVTTGFNQKIVTDERLPYKDNQFDIVITNHVLEHVPDQERHMAEMARVLKKGGIIYLASPNKWWLTDPHYKLPFISWLPRPVAGKYLSLAKGRKWDIYSVSLRRLHKLANDEELRVEDKSWDIITQPARYGVKGPKIVAKAAKRTPQPVVRALLHAVPTHLKILYK